MDLFGINSTLEEYFQALERLIKNRPINVPSSANISTTGRLRKLFANEFSSDETTKQLQMIIDKLLQNIH